LFLADLSCYIPGTCIATDILELSSITQIECQDQCKKSDLDCNYFSYDFLNRKCLLYDTCPLISTGCDSCQTAQKQCGQNTSMAQFC